MPGNGSPSTRRVALALALTAAFYALAAALAVGMIGLPVYLALAGDGSGLGAIALEAILLIAAGTAILVAITPRRTPFVAPGAELDRSEHPRLFALVEEVLPGGARNVYLTPGAEVTWLGRRRGLAIGLPALATHDAAGLRAAVARAAEGAGRLSEWTDSARASIDRALDVLRDDDDRSVARAVLAAPFELYAGLFLRLTGTAAPATPDPSVALARDHWERDVLPALRAGVRPPLAEGWLRVITPKTTAQPATSLLGDLDAAEAALAAWAGAAPCAGRVAWEALGERVHIPRHRAVAAGSAEQIADLTVASAIEWLVRGQPQERGFGPGFDEGRAAAADAIGSAIAVALADAGFAPEALPGRPFQLRRGNAVLAPLDAVAAAIEGRLAPEAWRARCEAAGVADLLLQPRTAATASATVNLRS